MFYVCSATYCFQSQNLAYIAFPKLSLSYTMFNYHFKTDILRQSKTSNGFQMKIRIFQTFVPPKVTLPFSVCYE